MLPGVGQGFFDDRAPQMLFDLGSTVVETPTFVGESGIGYAVTAGGLVRFDLGDPAGGARVVFAGQGVLAAQALANGLVVVALGGGAVKVLAPRGDGLIVVAQLQAQGGVPALPSSLAVLQKANGQVEVLVANQGDDTIFVFAPVVVGQGTPGGAGSSRSTGGPAQRSRSSSCRRLGSPRVPRAAPAVPARPERQDRPPCIAPGHDNGAAAERRLLARRTAPAGGRHRPGVPPGQQLRHRGPARLRVRQRRTRPGRGARPWLATSHAVGDRSP